MNQNQHEFEDNFANMNKLPINFSIPGHKVYNGGKFSIQVYTKLCMLTLPKWELWHERRKLTQAIVGNCKRLVGLKHICVQGFNMDLKFTWKVVKMKEVFVWRIWVFVRVKFH